MVGRTMASGTNLDSLYYLCRFSFLTSLLDRPYKIPSPLDHPYRICGLWICAALLTGNYLLLADLLALTFWLYQL
jgi:hypothetical protein|uniref:Uncharacterized protein n=1 Tax=Picea glauca TaxID=3330 RepID=A0A101LVT7_PICGL|nr:hypothetical protein ABT39_MTgene1775 [Picea glauca]QHR90866.1 hypothetical protein Q903MT_gene4893 [Picea sitchensis]